MRPRGNLFQQIPMQLHSERGTNFAANGPARTRSLVGPFELEFDLLFVPLSFVLDVELGARRHVDPLSGHLNLEPLTSLEGVGQPAQLRYELGRGVDLLDVPVVLFAHRSSPGSLEINLPVSYRLRRAEPNPSAQRPHANLLFTSHRSLVHDSTIRPGTRVNSRTLAVTIVSPCPRHVAASHRSCGPMRRPSAIRPAQSCACARATARSTGSSGKRSITASTNAERRARTLESTARCTP